MPKDIGNFTKQNTTPEQVIQEVRGFFEEEQRLEDEEKRKNVAQASEAAKIAVKEVSNKATINSADIQAMINDEEGLLLAWLYRTHPPDLSSVEALTIGEPKKGGSSNSGKRRKKKIKKMPKQHEFWELK